MFRKTILSAVFVLATLSSAFAAQIAIAPVASPPVDIEGKFVREALGRADANITQLFGGIPNLTTPILENVVTCPGLPNLGRAYNAGDRANRYANFRTACYAYTTLTAPSVWMPTFSTFAQAGGAEFGFGATTTYDDLRIEDQAGNLSQATWGGNTASPGTDGTIAKTDPIPLVAPIVGTKSNPVLFWIRGHVVSGGDGSTTGGLPFSGGGVNLESGSSVQYGGTPPGTNLAGQVGPIAQTGTAYPNANVMIRPLAVVQMDVIPSVIGGPATSRGYGTNDGYVGTLASQGTICRSVETFAPCLNLGVPGDRADWFMQGNNTNRIALMQLGTHGEVETTINDVTGGSPAATIINNLISIRNLFPTATKVNLHTTEPVALATVLPTTGATSSGVSITVSLTDTRSLFLGEFVTLAGSSTAGYNGKCQIESINPNTSFACVGGGGVPAASPAVGTITYTTDFQDYNQTATANNGVLTTVNAWKLSPAAKAAGFNNTIDVAKYLTTAFGSGHWAYSAMAQGGLTADGTHFKDWNGYLHLKNSGLISARSVN